MNYLCKIKFTTPYLQHRFTEDAKEAVEELIGKGIIKKPDDEWAAYLYLDGKEIYIPNIQIKNCLVNAGKEFKMKKQRRSMKVWVQSFVMVSPLKIYINKKKPDDVIVSFVKRKDGNRVKLQHPAFDSGTLVEFEIETLDDEIEMKAIKNLLIKGGKMYGIGARRADMFGRFELVDFKKVN